MKSVILSIALAASLKAQADVFSQYENQGRKILEISRIAQVSDRQLTQELNQIINLGYEIMKLVVQKAPECRAQYEQIRQDDSVIRKMTYEQIDRKYHDGDGLIAAPKSCYAGRSMVIHPYQMLTVVPGGVSVSEREEFDHEMLEVTERADKIKKSLGL